MNVDSQWWARVHNQYGLDIGGAMDVDRDVAIQKACAKARETIKRVNPNWKWKIKKVTAELLGQ